MRKLDFEPSRIVGAMILGALMTASLPAQEGIEEAIEDFMARHPLPEVVESRFDLPNLAAASTNTEDIGNGRIPDGFREVADRPVEALPESGSERLEPWNWTVASWEAPNTFSYPLYFEDRMLDT